MRNVLFSCVFQWLWLPTTWNFKSSRCSKFVSYNRRPPVLRGHMNKNRTPPQRQSHHDILLLAFILGPICSDGRIISNRIWLLLPLLCGLSDMAHFRTIQFTRTSGGHVEQFPSLLLLSDRSIRRSRLLAGLCLLGDSFQDRP